MSLATAAPAQGSNSIPALAEPSLLEGQSTPRAAEGEEKKKRRSLFGFGKKKTEDNAAKAPVKPAPSRKTTASPIQTDHGHMSPSSPGRANLASSPRLASPAGSQIFERDVQESAAALMPNSPAIPSHIQTENHIPPVLDASSEAITDDHLDPDTVEIITHTSHQPASLAVAGGLNPYEPSSSWADELAAFSAQRTSLHAASASTHNLNLANTTADTASNYGSFDTTDVRRLSFISFADVVQAEQAQAASASASRDSFPPLAGLTSLGIGSTRRSPSPVRSPVSSSGGGGGGGGGGGASPPASKSGSIRGGTDVRAASPAGRKPLGSPTSVLSMQLGSGSGTGSGGAGPTVSGEIAIETMREALRRTGSGELAAAGAGGGAGVRSFPASPV